MTASAIMVAIIAIILLQAALGALWRAWLGGMPPADLPLGRTFKWLACVLLCWPVGVTAWKLGVPVWQAGLVWAAVGGIVCLWFAIRHDNGRYWAVRYVVVFGLGYPLGRWLVAKGWVPNWPPLVSEGEWTRVGELWLGAATFGALASPLVTLI